MKRTSNSIAFENIERIETESNNKVISVDFLWENEDLDDYVREFDETIDSSLQSNTGSFKSSSFISNDGIDSVRKLYIDKCNENLKLKHKIQSQKKKLSDL